MTGGHTYITPIGVSAALDASGLPGYYSSPNAIDGSTTVMGNDLYIDVVNAAGEARQLVCTANGGTSGLEGGASLATACGSWATITYP